MTRVWAAIFFIVITGGTVQAAPPDNQHPIRFGLTAVVVRENLRFLDQWERYLSANLKYPVKFIRRRSYREVMDMLGSGGLDFAWICGYPFVQTRDPEYLKLLAVPVYKGAPLYHSYIIVHKDSPYRTFEDLRGKVFAYSDPESNSGFLYPQFLLADKRETSDRFFRQTFFTFNHAETIEAVADRFADGGAVDSYIWDYLSEFQPEIASQTRIIRESPTFGFPPLVVRSDVDPEVTEKMRELLVNMKRDPKGRPFLSGLKLDGFGAFSPTLFDSIRDMANGIRKAQTWMSAKSNGDTKMETSP
ncbi:MAG: phosphate/phosphite/phosphonate ABC transporter substrate-binding protein [Rhodospirillales bacterium]|nr:phosphate/phosphite/phosphonate ABC transporter substrate-binding protein [Rhodospirillales bacterium]